MQRSRTTVKESSVGYKYKCWTPNISQSLTLGVVATFLLSMPAIAFDDNFAICKDELSSIELRIDACEHASEHGNADAQLILGALYLGYLAEEVTEQDAKRGYDWIFKAAKSGNTDAQLVLGYMYDRGEGVDRDSDKAFKWFLKASENGNSIAQHHLAYLYLYGTGVEADSELAIKWLNSAAIQGSAEAQYELGLIYYAGKHGAEENFDEAAVWFRKAAEQGHIDAQYALGRMYEFGIGVMHDNHKAQYWLSLAGELAEKIRIQAEKGDPNAQWKLGYIFLIGKGVEINEEKARKWLEKAADNGNQRAADALRFLATLTTMDDYIDEIGESRTTWFTKTETMRHKFNKKLDEEYRKNDGRRQGKSDIWYKKAAEEGDAEAQYVLGIMYLKGEGVSQDYGMAHGWLEKSATKGDANAQYALGTMYAVGRGFVTQNYSQARKWFEESAENGNSYAQHALGIMYLKGEGVSQDYVMAHGWLEKSATQGDANAQHALGFMHEEGLGVVQDYGKARTWYEKSATQGDANAQHALGFMHEEGLGVAQDYGKARTWYQKSADQGYSNAQVSLGLLLAVVDNDAKAAINLWEKAARAGHGTALFYIGKMYLTERYLNYWLFQSRLFGFTNHLWVHSRDNIQPDDREASVWLMRFIEWAKGYDIKNRSSSLNQKVKKAEHYVQRVKKEKKLIYASALYEVEGDLRDGKFGIQKDPDKADEYLRLAALYGNHYAVKHFFSKLASTKPKTKSCEPLLILYGGAWDDEFTIEENYRRLFMLLTESSYSGSGVVRDYLMEFLEFVYGGYGIELKYYGVKSSEDGDVVNDSVNLVNSRLRESKDSPIVLIGHSWGGSVAYKVAKLVENRSQVLLVTLDAVGKDPVDSNNTSHTWLAIHTIRSSGWEDIVAKLGKKWGDIDRAKNYRFDGSHADVVEMYSTVHNLIHDAILCK